jgi:hypothetical protein
VDPVPERLLEMCETALSCVTSLQRNGMNCGIRLVLQTLLYNAVCNENIVNYILFAIYYQLIIDKFYFLKTGARKFKEC